MTALTLHDDFLAMRARFHRALAISVGVHALLALGLLLADEAHPDLPRIIEVTWLEPVEVPEPAPVDRRQPRPARRVRRAAPGGRGGGFGWVAGRRSALHQAPRLSKSIRGSTHI